MTQPQTGALDVAYVEIHPDAKDFSNDLNSDIEEAYAKLETTTKDTTAVIDKQFKILADNVEGHFRDINGRLHDQNGRFVAESARSSAQVQDSSTNTINSLTQLFDLLDKKVTDFIEGPLKKIAPIFLKTSAVVLAAVVGIQGIPIAIAALAASPGIILGLAGAFGILAAATSGIGAAFKELTTQQKKVSSGGVSLAQQQRQEANAQRELTQAQLDLNAARAQAIRDIERLNVDLIKARANQLRSADDLRKAEILLEQTRKVGTADQINEATIAYEEAKAAAADDAQATKELEQDKKKADKNGVEGSDRVRAAIERVKDAQDALAQAQLRLGASATVAASAFAGLTASAQNFVLKLVKAKEELKPLQKQIQETFFSGTGDLLGPITDNIKENSPTILSLTETLNKSFRGLLKFLGGPEFEAAGKGALKGLQDLILAVSPSVLRLLDAFAGLAAQFGATGKDGESAGTKLGQTLGRVLDRISGIINKLDLQQTFKDARKAIDDLKPTLSSVWTLLKNVFDFLKFIAPAVIGTFKFVVDTINAGVDFIKGAINDVQALGDRIHGFTVGLNDQIYGFVDRVKKFLRDLKDTVKGTINSVGDTLNELVDKIFGLRNRLFSAGKSLAQSLFSGFSDSTEFVKNFSSKITNGLIRGINTYVLGALNKGIDKIENGFNKVPGLNVSLFKFPKIPELEKGGLVTGDTLIRAGEKGKAEGVIPLEDPRALAAIGRAIANASPKENGPSGIVFGPGAVVVNFTGAVPSEIEALRTGNAVGSGIIAALARQTTRLNVRTIGTHG